MIELIQSVSAGLRLDQLSPRRWQIYAKTAEKADEVSRALLASGKVTKGIEGHEYMRRLGLIQHVYVLKLGSVRVRIVETPYPPRGMFSHLKELEREVRI